MEPSVKSKEREKKHSFDIIREPDKGIDYSIISTLNVIDKRFGLKEVRCFVKDDEEEDSLTELYALNKKGIRPGKNLEETAKKEALSYFKSDSCSIQIMGDKVLVPLARHEEKKVGVLYFTCKRKRFCESELSLLKKHSGVFVTYAENHINKKYLVESMIASKALLIFFLVILGLFMYISVLTRYFENKHQMVLVCVFIAPFGLLVLTNKYFYSLKDWGFYRFNLPEIKQYLYVTVIMCILLTLLKYFLVMIDPAKYGTSVFVWNPFKQTGSSLSIYLLGVAFQEIGARVIPYTLLKKAFRDQNFRVFATVIVSFVVFSVPHVWLSFETFLISTFGGLVWIILYLRTPNYYGVTLNHALVGAYMFLLLGFFTSGVL